MDLRSLLGGLLTPDSADAPAPLPLDPMDEALPPHLRQFYGSPESAPTLPPPALTRPQPGQTVAPGEVRLQEKAMAAARDAYNSVMSGAAGATEGLLGPLERGAESAGEAVSGALDRAGKAVDDFTGPLKEEYYRAKEGARLQSLGMPLPPGGLPKRSKSDPYYGYEWPKLERRQPGQMFFPPDQPPLGVPTWSRERGWIMPWDNDYPGQKLPDPRGAPQQPPARRRNNI